MVSALWGAVEAPRRALMLFLGLSLATAALADTEVSGEVSGEWTAEGSPYIVVDSTWIAEGNSLNISHNVDVVFNENQGLYIFGVLETHGNELAGDSVRFQVNRDVEHWKGLRFYGENRTELNCTQIICPDIAFFLDRGYELEMNNCTLEAEEHTFRSHEDYRVRGYLYFFHSEIRGGVGIYSSGGLVHAVNSRFEFIGDNDAERQFHGSSTGYNFSNCIVYGGLSPEFGYSIIEDCQFVTSDYGQRFYVVITGSSGSMRNTLVEGAAAIAYGDSETIPFINNTIFAELTVSGCSAEISGCDIRGLIKLGDCQNIYIHNSILSRSFGTLGVADSVRIDSCIFTHKTSETDYFLADYSYYLEVTRSVFRTDNFHIHCPAIMDHNTFVFDYVPYSGINANDSVLWTNNIFLTLSPGGRLFSQKHMPPSFKYNCVWGFDAYAGPLDSAIYDIDTTCIEDDPRLDWFGDSPLLAVNSPCIDTGDPEAPLDPDGTRSDMGAWYFYQKNSGTEPYPPTRQPQLFSTNASPNPFNNLVSLDYQIPFSGRVRLAVYDLAGREVSVLADQWLETDGKGSASWSSPSSGIFIANLQWTDSAGKTRFTSRKIVCVK